MKKIQIVPISSLTPVLPQGMAFSQRQATGGKSGAVWLTGYAGGMSLVLDSRQGQLAEFLELANNFEQGRLCFSRFGFGSRGNEVRWVKRHGPALLGAGVLIPGAWRVMLGLVDAVIEVCVSPQCESREVFFDQLAAALMSFGVKDPSRVSLVPSSETPIHWVREFCDELGYEMTILSGQDDEGRFWKKEDAMAWLCTDRVFVRRAGSRFVGNRIKKDSRVEGEAEHG